MRKNYTSFVMLIIAISCMTGGAVASSIYFSPASLTLTPGSTGAIKVMLSDAPMGLIGYEMILTYPASTVTATDASFPSWAGLNNKYSTSTGYLISGIDMNKQVQSGATNIELATVTMKGVAEGTTTIFLTGFRMNDDEDSLASPTLGTFQVTVEAGETPTITQTTATSSSTATTATTTVTTTTTTKTTTTVPATTGATTTITTVTTTSTTAFPAATITVPAVVMVPPALAGSPTCGFTTNKVADYAPMEVRFRDLSTGESLSGWEWSFGDGGSSMTQNPTYIYRTPGTYTVVLTVSNDLGSTTSTRTGLIHVLGPGETIPTVTMAAPPVTTATTEPARSLPDWTSPQRTAAANATKQADSALLTVLGGIGLGACLIFILQRDNRP